ncbi:hypothetical protein AC579_9284 [Pseudocercospora musae]|uniref:Uncharacterized protein n=1 Tax=Pseudocercospora musae TaxID=113226 RepID=A0A139HEI9_9PEZI|nr:hypothetical protein AC579_9284 [Pseudocercospora musae]
MSTLLKKLSIKAKSKDMAKDGKIQSSKKPSPDHDEQYEQQFRQSQEQRPSLLGTPGNAGRHPSQYGLAGDESTPVPGEVYGHGGHYQGAKANEDLRMGI